MLLRNEFLNIDKEKLTIFSNGIEPCAQNGILFRQV